MASNYSQCIYVYIYIYPLHQKTSAIPIPPPFEMAGHFWSMRCLPNFPTLESTRLTKSGCLVPFLQELNWCFQQLWFPVNQHPTATACDLSAAIEIHNGPPGPKFLWPLTIQLIIHRNSEVSTFQTGQTA